VLILVPWIMTLLTDFSTELFTMLGSVPRSGLGE
jgi:hypothetical protein